MFKNPHGVWIVFWQWRGYRPIPASCITVHLSSSWADQDVKMCVFEWKTWPRCRGMKNHVVRLEWIIYCQSNLSTYIKAQSCLNRGDTCRKRTVPGVHSVAISLLFCIWFIFFPYCLIKMCHPVLTAVIAGWLLFCLHDYQSLSQYCWSKIVVLTLIHCHFYNVNYPRGGLVSPADCHYQRRMKVSVNKSGCEACFSAHSTLL